MNSTYPLTSGHVICPDCGGSGDAHHPRWGKPSCPTDLVKCPVCNGGGEVEDDFDAQREQGQNQNTTHNRK